MADYKISQETMTNIANAVRAKKGTTAKIKGEDIAETIQGITAKDISKKGTMTYYSNGTKTIDIENYNKVNIQVPSSSADPDLQAKSVTPLSLPTTITADSGYDGLSQVTVNKDANLSSGNIKNGVTIFGVTGNYSGSGTTVTLQNKTVTPAINAFNVSADSGYTGLGTVTVKGMSENEVVKAKPDISIGSNGVITAEYIQGAGYVSYGKVSNTKVLPVQSAKTITPSTKDQVAAEANTYVTGKIQVKGDVNLVPENIRVGTSIFGIEGEYDNSGPAYVHTVTIQNKTAAEAFATYSDNGANTSSITIPSNGSKTIQVGSSDELATIYLQHIGTVSTYNLGSSFCDIQEQFWFYGDDAACTSRIICDSGVTIQIRTIAG